MGENKVHIRVKGHSEVNITDFRSHATQDRLMQRTCGQECLRRPNTHWTKYIVVSVLMILIGSENKVSPKPWKEIYINIMLRRYIDNYIKLQLTIFLCSEKNTSETSLQIHIVKSNVKQNMPALPKLFAKTSYLPLPIICERLSHWTLVRIIYYIVFPRK